MQYISIEMLRDESVVAYARVKTAHAAWQASPQPDTLEAFRKMYLQYSVIYNEIMDRETPKSGRHLAAFAQLLPPPPPGATGEGSEPPAPRAPVETLPVGRDLEGASGSPDSSTAPLPDKTGIKELSAIIANAPRV
jgi:hypothetical protein